MWLGKTGGKRVKWTNKIKNTVVPERVGEDRIMLELIKNRKRNWLGLWLRINCLLKDALQGKVNGKKFATGDDVK